MKYAILVTQFHPDGAILDMVEYGPFDDYALACEEYKLHFEETFADIFHEDNSHGLNILNKVGGKDQLGVIELKEDECLSIFTFPLERRTYAHVKLMVKEEKHTPITDVTITDAEGNEL